MFSSQIKRQMRRCFDVKERVVISAAMPDVTQDVMQVVMQDVMPGHDPASMALGSWRM